MSTQRSPSEMEVCWQESPDIHSGSAVDRTSANGLRFPLLRSWVGPLYAAHTLLYLRILVFANLVRSLCAPYATMIAATGKLGVALRPQYLRPL